MPWEKAAEKIYKIENLAGIIMTQKPTYEELKKRVQELKTDYSQLENKLLESRSFTEEIMTYMTEGLVLTDIRGTVIFINQRLSGMLGYLSEEIIGKCWLDMVPVEQHAIAKEAEARRAQGHTARYEIMLHRKDGHKFPVLIGAGPRFDKQSGEFIGTMGVVSDITKRKQAEEELANTLAATTDGIWTLNFKTGGLFFSQRFYTMLGYEPFEFPASYETWVSLIHNEDLERAVGMAEEYLKTKPDVYENEFRMKTRNGEYRWVHAKARVVRWDKDGNAEYMIGNHEDITDRKLVEESVARSAEEQHILLENIQTQIWYLTDDHTYGAVNKAHADFMGVPIEDLAFKNMYDSFPEDVVDVCRQGNVEVFTTGKPVRSEEWLPHVSGERRLISILKSPKLHADGTVEYVVCSAEDITERKQAEETEKKFKKDLEKRNFFIQTVLDKLPIGLAVNYIEDGTATYMNKKFEEIYGWPKQQLENIEEFFHKVYPDQEYREKIMKQIFEDITSGDPERMAWEGIEITRKDGEKRIISGKNIALYEQNFMISTVQDITENKRLHAQLSQLQKSESLGRMAGAIAHHFNNHLHAVMGNLEMAMDDLPLGVNSNKNLVSALHAARKAADVSRLMLTYLGQTSGKHEPIDLSRACRRSLSLVQTIIPKGVTVNIDFPDSGPVIRANEGQINQALTNLITNAWESISNNQGTISLAIRTVDQVPDTKRLPIDWQPQEIAYACLEISDTGCGISIKEIEKIFDPFFTSKFTGRGMGLPVVMGIVKAHGGCITVDSEAGCGSIFRMYLSILTEKIPLPLEPEKPVAALVQKVEKGGTVLIIEDEAMIRNTAKIMLSRLGYTVIDAKDGVEALEIFQQRQNEVCCVISDLTMPRMGGWETLTELRKIQNDVRVILASGHNKDVVMAGDHPEQPQAFLYKPYSMSALKEALAKAMSV